jgi:hypothetical protein
MTFTNILGPRVRAIAGCRLGALRKISTQLDSSLLTHRLGLNPDSHIRSAADSRLRFQSPHRSF